MTRIVVDASIVVRWYVSDDPLHLQALETKQRHDLLAPAVLQAETANALWKYVRRDMLKVDDACESVAVLPDLIALVEDRLLLASAQRLSAANDRPVYDCLYLALAQREALDLVTADRSLARLGEAIGLSTTLVQRS